jgi:hypothetical protein
MRNNKRLLAYYLPAFYQTLYNDEWWGEGFTEWDHVRKAQPLFRGHQVLKPHSDIGYYEMGLETMRKQQAMAKQYGIDGFVLYHYWFEGRQVLDMPFNLIMQNKDLDLPFCLMWANENWTRNWDGQKDKILIEQKYSQEDCERFIHLLAEAFKDERYIRVDGKPLLMLYNSDDTTWTDYMGWAWKNILDNDVFIIHRTRAGKGDRFNENIEVQNNWDGAFEFAPRNMGLNSLNSDDDFYVFDYKSAVASSLLRYETDKRFFQTIIPSWDNSPRMGNKAHIIHGSSPELFCYWLDEMTRKTKEDIVFINAWNEWGEGAVLEPSELFDYEYLEALTKPATEIDLTDIKKRFDSLI